MKKSHKLAIVLFVIGLALRFEVQFLEPFFNNDEIDLGMNVNQRGFVELLKPLKHYQTAPPLFLCFMKLVYLIPFGATWIKYKIVFFVLSGVFIYLVYDMAKRLSEDPKVPLIALAIVGLNPFFIYHSLTLKQYVLDAIIVMPLVKSQFRPEASKPHKLLWVLAPLLSNPVLFVYTAFLLSCFWRLFQETINTSKSFLIRIGAALRSFFNNVHYRWFWGPILVYILYFLWYKSQDGYVPLTRFMWDFWRLTFFSNSHDFFIRIYYFFIGNVTFIFSHDKTLANLGTVLLGIGLVYFYKSKRSETQRFMVRTYLGALAVFVVLNFLKMYPIAPRLLLFVSPLIVVLIAISGEIKQGVYRVFWWILIATGFVNYTLYMPFKENDVLAMAKRLEEQKPARVFFSMNSVRAIRKFDAFTENAFQIESRYIHKPEFCGNTDSLFILKLVHQFGREGENGPIMESCIRKSAELKRIQLIQAADGFNLYKIHDPSILKEFVQAGVLHPDYLERGKIPQTQNPFWRS